MCLWNFSKARVFVHMLLMASFNHRSARRFVNFSKARLFVRLLLTGRFRRLVRQSASRVGRTYAARKTHELIDLILGNAYASFPQSVILQTHPRLG